MKILAVLLILLNVVLANVFADPIDLYSIFLILERGKSNGNFEINYNDGGKITTYTIFKNGITLDGNTDYDRLKSLNRQLNIINPDLFDDIYGDLKNSQITLNNLYNKFLEYTLEGNKISTIKTKYDVAKLRIRPDNSLKNKNIKVDVNLITPRNGVYANRFAVIYSKLKTMNIDELQDIKNLMNKARLPRAMTDIFRFPGAPDDFKNNIKSIIGLTDLDMNSVELRASGRSKIIALENDLNKINKLTEYIGKYDLTKIKSTQTFGHLKFMQNTYYLDNIKRTPPPLCTL